VAWTFVVENVGAEPLTEVAVNDDGVHVPCPKTSLEPQESMTCTLRGTALGCEQHDVGRVVAYGPGLLEVSDEDHAYYTGLNHHASLDVEMRINGEDADDTPWPVMFVGQPIQWTIVVTNTGDSDLVSMFVGEEQGVFGFNCPKFSLQPREAMICTATSLAQAGMHRHLGVAAGMPPCSGWQVRQADPAGYIGQIRHPAIDLEKLTGDQDADQPPGPEYKLGAPLTWTFVISNTGDQPLTSITLTDIMLPSVTCPKTELAVGESMTCTFPTHAGLACEQVNIATVSGKAPDGVTVSDEDAAWYFGLPSPAISLEMRIEGQDADTPPGPLLLTGTTAHWTYAVTNTGAAGIFYVKVTDDHLGVVTCPKDILNWGETITCAMSTPVFAGQYSSRASAEGVSVCAMENTYPYPDVWANDPAHYFGITPAIDLETLDPDEDPPPVQDQHQPPPERDEHQRPGE
jgi:uncharacterized repeat protein (TIGR01451 family)